MIIVLNLCRVNRYIVVTLMVVMFLVYGYCIQAEWKHELVELAG